MSPRFVPFDAADDEIHVLLDGVPDWMRGSIVRWILDAIPRDYKLFGPQNHRRYYYDGARLRDIERSIGRSLQVGTSTEIKPVDLQGVLNRVEEGTLLRIADYWLASNSSGLGEDRAVSLEEILHQGRSRWAVREVDKKVRLAGRVAEGAQDAAEDVMRTRGTAGRHLKDAWEAIHALTPDPPKAYSSSIKAVESASRPNVLPQNLKATLGTIKTQLHRDSDWQLPIFSPSEHAIENLPLEMVRALNDGQDGRHGEDEYKDVTYEQARTAVMLAVTLVDLFSEGIIRRAPGT